MRKTIFILALLLSAFTINAVAQFEGKIIYTIYDNDDDGDNEDSFTTYITPQRILVQGDESFDVKGMMKTDGMLIRLDKKDFVFFTSDNEAMSISKAGITSFINMFGELGKSQKDTQDDIDDIKKNYTFENTGETQTIEGYTATKFVYENKTENQKGTIWMTREIDINWGMLAEPWGDSVAFLTSEDMPSNVILQEGWLPLKGTFYKDGEVDGEFKATVNEMDIADSKVNIATGVTLTSLSEYLFQHMRQQQ